MAQTLEERRVAIVKEWVAKAAAAIDADASIRLWTGETLPLGRDVRGPIIFAVNAPEAVRRLVLAPDLMTLLELYVEGLLDIEGGTPLDAARSYDHMRALSFGRSLSKVELVRSLWPFMRGEKGERGFGLEYMRKVRSRHGRGRDDRAMVSHHYDVGNEFYALFLGPQLIYSPGYYATRDMALTQAEERKLDIVCAKLGVGPGTRMLDIGCGWGSLAIRAAERGAHVVGVTLSDEQHALATERVRRAGLADRVRIELRDYRDVPAERQFDAVSQVGMAEHLGLDNHDDFYARVHDLLRPRGRYFHEVVHRAATRNRAAFRKPSVYQRIISRYIFPGGELDHVGMAVENMERFRLEVHDVENVREHYRLSLEHWVARLWTNRAEAERLVGWPRTRLWLFYMSLCAVGFDRGACTAFQITASRRKTGNSELPLSRRAWLKAPPDGQP